MRRVRAARPVANIVDHVVQVEAVGRKASRPSYNRDTGRRVGSGSRSAEPSPARFSHRAHVEVADRNAKPPRSGVKRTLAALADPLMAQARPILPCSAKRNVDEQT